MIVCGWGDSRFILQHLVQLAQTKYSGWGEIGDAQDREQPAPDPNTPEICGAVECRETQQGLHSEKQKAKSESRSQI
jgi:hypothetical protein